MHIRLGTFSYIILFSIAILFLAGCVATSKDTTWNLAKQVNTPEAYEDFINRYPNSLEAAEAKKLFEESKPRFEKSRWIEVKESNSVQIYINYALMSPQSPYLAEIPDRAFNVAIESNNSKELYLFLTHFPSHAGIHEVSLLLENLEFEKAKEDTSPLAIDLFLKKYPSSKYTSQALLSLEDKYFQKVQQLNSVLGHKAYLRRFPEGRYVSQARSKLQATGSMGAPTYTGEDPQSLLNGVRKIRGIRQHARTLVIAEKILAQQGSENVGTYVLRNQLDSIFKKDSSYPIYGFEPIGIKVRWDSEGWPIIEAVLSGSPAQKSGLKVGDKILTIYDRSMQNAGWFEYLLAISGAPGGPVNLSIESQGTVSSHEIKRQTASIARFEGAEKTLAGISNAGADLRFEIDDEKAFSEAASALLKLHEEETYLLKQINLYRQKDVLFQKAITAAAQLTDDIEADELTREVLGSTEYEPQVFEKGSETAKKAMRRLEYIKGITLKNLKEVAMLLKELKGHVQTAQDYVISFIQYGPSYIDLGDGGTIHESI